MEKYRKPWATEGESIFIIVVKVDRTSTDSNLLPCKNIKVVNDSNTIFPKDGI